MRRCTSCHEEKSLDAFPRKPNGQPTAWCRLCWNRKQREWQHARKARRDGNASSPTPQSGLTYQYRAELVCTMCVRRVGELVIPHRFASIGVVPVPVRCRVCGGAAMPSGDTTRVGVGIMRLTADDLPRRGRPTKEMLARRALEEAVA